MSSIYQDLMKMSYLFKPATEIQESLRDAVVICDHRAVSQILETHLDHLELLSDDFLPSLMLCLALHSNSKVKEVMGDYGYSFDTGIKIEKKGGGVQHIKTGIAAFLFSDDSEEQLESLLDSENWRVDFENSLKSLVALGATYNDEKQDSYLDKINIAIENIKLHNTFFDEKDLLTDSIRQLFNSYLGPNNQKEIENGLLFFKKFASKLGINSVYDIVDFDSSEEMDKFADTMLIAFSQELPSLDKKKISKIIKECQYSATFILLSLHKSGHVFDDKEIETLTNKSVMNMEDIPPLLRMARFCFDKSTKDIVGILTLNPKSFVNSIEMLNINNLGLELILSSSEKFGDKESQFLSFVFKKLFRENNVYRGFKYIIEITKKHNKLDKLFEFEQFDIYANKLISVYLSHADEPKEKEIDIFNLVTSKMNWTSNYFLNDLEKTITNLIYQGDCNRATHVIDSMKKANSSLPFIDFNSLISSLLSLGLNEGDLDDMNSTKAIKKFSSEVRCSFDWNKTLIDDRCNMKVSSPKIRF